MTNTPKTPEEAIEFGWKPWIALGDERTQFPIYNAKQEIVGAWTSFTKDEMHVNFEV